MGTTNWIISMAGIIISILLGVSSYFIVKWIQQVDETLKEQSKDIKDNTVKIVSLESKQNTQTENITKAVHSQLSAFKFPHEQVDKIEQEVRSLKDVTQKKVLPAVEKYTESFGKVLLLEKNLDSQNDKLFKMYKILELLAKKPVDPK